MSDPRHAPGNGLTGQGSHAERRRLWEVVMRAPAIIATLHGPTHVFDIANTQYLQFVGNRDILGKPVAEALPEVVEQGFIELLDRVYRSGEPFTANGMRVFVDRRGDGVLVEGFLNFVYQPLFAADGSVSGIFIHAVEVTDQVRSREAAERLAAELQTLNEEMQAQATYLEEAQAELEMANDDLQQANRELREREGHAALLAGVGLALTQSGPLDDVLQRCTELIVTHLGAAFARIWTLNEGEQVLELCASAGIYTHLNGPHSRVPVGALKIGKIASEKQAHLTNDVVRDPRVSDKEWAQREGMTAFAGYPLMIEDEVVGVVALFSRNALSESTLDALKSVADGMAVAIERAAAVQALRRHADHQRGLTESALAITAALSVESVLRVITEQARAVIGAHQSVTSITAGDQDLAQAITAVSLSDKYAQWRSYDEKPDGSGIYRLVVESNQAIRLTQGELEAHPAWSAFGRHAAAHPPMRGWLAVPLVGRELRNLGLIQLSDKYEGEFTAEDEARLTQYARIASLAIENAWLYDAALDANRVKAEFLATMSHELRTPLNAILGYADLLLLGVPAPISAASQTQVERMRTSAKHLLSLIDEVLSFSRLEAGREQINLEHVDVSHLAREMAALVAPLAQAKGVALVVNTHEPVPEYETDAGKVRQILLNLLSNAVKFTDEGQIELNVFTADRSVVLEVRDTGMGVPAGQLDQIFEPFRQVEGGMTRRSGGTGLGLSVTRQLAHLLDGDVAVESVVGRGSTFTVRLPVRQP